MLRLALALAAVAGAVLLVVSTFLAVIQIRVLTTGDIAADIDTEITGGERHSVALVVVGVFALLMLAGALRAGARAAMTGLLVAGLLALGIAVLSDARHIHDTGQVGQLYEQASADAGPGFFLETLGGALLVVAGGGMLLLGIGTSAGPGDGSRTPRRQRRERPRRRREETAPPTQEPAADPDDWWST